jgi:hypothetical protein
MTPEETAAETTAAAATAAATALADLQRENAELKEQSAEHQRTAEFWAQKAKATPAAAAATADVEDDPDVLEAITTGGAKGFDALAKKRGFVQKDEVEALINTKAAQLTKEQELIGRYPELRQKTSDFFKTTASFYGDLVKSGTPQALAMELAAEKTELEFMRSGKLKPAGAEPTKAEKEATRLARVAAQSGEGGGRRSAAAEADDDELSPEQKRIADAMGVSHEAYLKRAKAGVKMGGTR